ncbi:5-oxoprolinase subunit C family protein [Carboxylicivirga marina]|uniref:Biotin-dependent carboxyltransferase family protein n=1 Tax=Carboxylicivirga marina TaxID=2800988 RepID=A0ABS1HLM2_9BACT|nr:biotin-dependent carboxyltransferase family protein [Carboxylicivirga marina]MBK3518583.1 biotin-dependent carboxyltransferase family protein [Carboxylicivirga marina]
MGKIKILKPGLLSTIQDLGRVGYQQFGMPVSGAMDTHALQMANLLVGNKPSDACIEATLMGPEIEFMTDAQIGLAGALSDVTINNIPVDAFTNHLVKKGDVLKTDIFKQGSRLYIAIAGGFDVPVVMGSQSTYLRGKLGGYGGRALQEGDEIEIGKGRAICQRRLNPDCLLLPQNTNTINVIAAIESEAFTLAGITNFLSENYTVSSQSDRMGYRLNGPHIAHRHGADILSAGIANGTIQVPAHGEPIIMLADRQTIGGYTKIANVISADLPLLGQMKAGDKIRFKEVRLDEAHRLLREQNEMLLRAITAQNN